MHDERVTGSGRDGVSPKRRRLLVASLSLVGAGVAVAAPDRWVKPVIDRVILPAHAQGSFETARLVGPRFQISGDFTDSMGPVTFDCNDVAAATLRIRIQGTQVTAVIGANNVVTGTGTLSANNTFTITNFGINELRLEGLLSGNQVVGTFRVGGCEPTPYTAVRV
jgi:hypothetical protein